MLVPVPDVLHQNQLLIGLLFLVIAITSRVKRSVSLSKETTTELKGFAILTVVFAHIGFYLAEDTRFLFPLSISAGVGVNLFLFLSGYGLTHSMLHRPLSAWEFYKKRLAKLFVPLWVLLAVLFLADWLFLHRTYSFHTLLQSAVGFFPKANLYENIDSPLWYFTFILFYYLLYPLVFFRYAPIISSILLAGASYLVTTFIPLPVDEGVLGVYQVHIYAFPLGALCAAVWQSRIRWLERTTERVKQFFERPALLSYTTRGGCIIALTGAFLYLSIHGDIGKEHWIEQRTSLLTMFTVIGLFLLKPFETRLLFWTGLFSYEIYLLHWPLVYRYDLFYRWLPAWLATFLYLFAFLLLGHAFQRFVDRLNKRLF